MPSKEDDAIEEELPMANKEVKVDISLAKLNAKEKEHMLNTRQEQDPDSGAGNKETTGATESQRVERETATASMYESFSEIVELPAPLPSRVLLRTSTPGAHATPGTPRLSLNRTIEGTGTVADEVQLPEINEEVATMVEAEIAPDIEDLEAENTALKELLQRIQETEQDIVLAEPVNPIIDNKWRAIWIGAAFLCGFVLIIVVIILVLQFPKNKVEDPDAQVQDASVAHVPEDYVFEGQDKTPPPIPDYDFNTTRIQVLQNLFEPLYGDVLSQDQDAKSLRALHWLANEDPATLDLTTTPFYELHERYILALLYFSTNGWNWNNKVNWLSAFTVCRWENVNCEPKELKRVRELALSKNNLDGTIPKEIGNLEILERCDLAYNQISGTVPTEYGKLPFLGDFSLGTNKLSGSLPSELGNLGQLFFFSCSGNRLSGSIPTEFGNLTAMKWFYIGENRLTGTLPLQMESLPFLETFHFHGNNLTGSANLIVCNATDTSVALADAGADCLEEIQCFCCKFCCDDKICCDRPETGDGDWTCADKQRRLLDLDLNLARV